MELKKWKKAIPGFIHKYRYAVLVLIIGLSLMLLPSDKNSSSTQAKQPDTQTIPVPDLGEQLSEILSSISGAGKVRVLLTTDTGQELVYQLDQETSKDGSGSDRTTTVIVSDGQRNESGLVRQTNSAKYRGAIIVCQGADDPVVRLAIVEAVSNATGLGTDRISVLKMK